MMGFFIFVKSKVFIMPLVIVNILKSNCSIGHIYYEGKQEGRKEGRARRKRGRIRSNKTLKDCS